MKTFSIPHTELVVSAICYGTVTFGTVVQEEAADRLFEQFQDAGGNFLDTAHCYAFWLENGQGASERGLGGVIRRHHARDRVVVATKGGHQAAGDEYPRPDGYLSPETLHADIDDSLSRLDMEMIDLYYLHRDDARLSVGEIIEPLNEEIQRGRLRYLGASNWRTERIVAANAYAAAHGLQGFVASQPQYSLAHWNVQPTVDPCIRTLTADDLRWHTQTQFPVVAYSSTACGYFAGSMNAGTMEQFDNAISQARHTRARKLADELQCSPNQIALAYLLHQPFPVIPITGTVNPNHLADALGAVDVSLTEEQVRWLRDG